jgi:DNA invertase Pin-like site-specific DNA recombinase
MQTRELREYAERRGWTVAAHHRRFDAVVVWKFDRFARSVSHLLRALETFRAQGLEFVSFSEQLDTSTRPASWSLRSLAPWLSWSVA